MTALASEAGFTEAYRDHSQRAFAAAFRVLGDVAGAEDVVQDVFAALWRDPSKFDARRGSLSGYVAMMARSRAVDRMRSRSARHAAIDRLAVRETARAHEAESPSDSVVRHDERTRVLCALSGLPAPQREAILLAYGGGMSTAEIARAAGVPLGTAKSRLRLGLRRARRALTRPAAVYR